MKELIRKLAMLFYKKQPQTEAATGFKGENKMKKTEVQQFRKMTKKYGIAITTIIAKDLLLQLEADDLSFEEWRSIYLHSENNGELDSLAKRMMFETATDPEQVIHFISSFTDEEKVFLGKALQLAGNSPEKKLLVYSQIQENALSAEEKADRDKCIQELRSLCGMQGEASQ